MRLVIPLNILLKSSTNEHTLLKITIHKVTKIVVTFLFLDIPTAALKG